MKGLVLLATAAICGDAIAPAPADPPTRATPPSSSRATGQADAAADSSAPADVVAAYEVLRGAVEEGLRAFADRGVGIGHRVRQQVDVARRGLDPHRKEPVMIRCLRNASVVTALALASSDPCAQSAVNGPYYATPSWDQTLPVASRFLVLSNFNGQAVLDRETGLVWEQAPSAVMQPYPNAFTECNGLAIGRRLGWRLPSTSELGTLLDPMATSAPALPVGHPFSMPPGGAAFWSTTPSIVSSGRGTRYITSYNAAGVIGSAFVGESTPIGRWCVRGPGDPVGAHF